MGDDLSTGAKIGIGLVILCFLIAIVLALLMVVKNITNSGANQMEAGLDQMMATTYDDYDQKVVTGTKVVSAVKLFSSEPIGIVVYTDLCKSAVGKATQAAPGGYCYGRLLEKYTNKLELTSVANENTAYYSQEALMKSTDTDTYYTSKLHEDTSKAPLYNTNTRPLTASGQQTYVRTSAKFLAELIRDSSQTIVGISFKQQT